MKDIEEVKSILSYMEIQIKKLEDAVSETDKQYTEIAQATDAIRFDFENLKARINERN